MRLWWMTRITLYVDLDPPQIFATVGFGIFFGALLNAVAAALESLGTVGLMAISETDTNLSHVAQRVLLRGPRIRDSLLAFRVGCVASTSALAALYGHSIQGRVGASVGVFAVAACYVVLAQIAATIARRRPSTVALHLLRILRPFEWLLLPFTIPLGWLRKIIESVVPVRAAPGSDPERLAEIAVEQVLEQSEALGSINEGQALLLWNVLEFKNTVAREIMVPRTRAVAFDIDTPTADVVLRIIETQHSRYPVYRGSLDHVLGVLFAKDLFRAIRDAGGESSVSLAAVLRRPVFMVPEDKKIGEVLRTMQKKRIHLAVVTDEFGGASGIVTLEDIVEEIVGEIQDEHDEDEPPVRETEPGRLVADASVGIYDLEEQFGVSLPREEAEVDSIGGLVAHVAGRVPRVGESVEIGDFEVLVIAGDRQRVTTVEIRRREPPTPEPSAAA